VISPQPSSATEAAQLNAKRKRKRVQKKCGEVLTEADSVARLKDEEARKSKKDSAITRRRKTCKEEQDH
jgi:hypothetical protein